MRTVRAILLIVKYLELFQILLTAPDLEDEFSRNHLRQTLIELMKLNIIPIINANDAVAPPAKLNADLKVKHLSTMSDKP